MPMTAALWSDLIPQTFGACFGGSYESVTSVTSFFQQTGLRTARLGRVNPVTPDNAGQRALVNALYDAGVRTVIAICDEQGPPTLQDRINEVLNFWDPRLEVIFEPLNEPQRPIATPADWAQTYASDSNRSYTGATFGVLEVRRQLLDLWQNRGGRLVLMPALATKSIFETQSTPGWYSTLGDVSDRINLGNLHCYAGGRPLPKDGDMAAYLSEIAAKSSGNVPLIVTEMGWHDMMDTTGTHIATPPAAQQVYTARGLFEVAALGVKRAVFYEAVDDPAAGQASAATYYEQHFGLSTLNADNTVALKDQNGAQIAYVTGLYSDRSVSSYAPQPLNVSVTPGSGSTNDVVTDLRQNSRGTWLLAVWRNKSVWAGARYGQAGYPGSPISVPDTPFLITLPRGMRVKEHRPAVTYSSTPLAPDTAGRTATTSSYTRMIGPDAAIYEIAPSLVGYVSGSTGSGSSQTVQVTLPANIPDGSTLILSSASSAAGTATPSGISGAFTRVPGSGNPDGAGSTMPTYCWSAPVGSADSGATVTVTFSTSTAHNTVIGGVWAGQVTPTGTFAAIASGSGTAPTCTAQGGVTVELAHARIASGTTTVTLPDTSTSTSTGTSAGSGNIGSTIAECTSDGGTGGTITSSPAAAKIAAYTVSMAPTPKASAAATLSNGSTLTASATRQTPAAAALTATSTLTAAAQATTSAATALTASSTLTASATRQVPAAPALTSTSTLSAGSTVTSPATASLTAPSTLTASATRQVPAAAALTSTSTLTAGSTVTSPATASLTAPSTLTASATRQVPAAAALTSTSTLTAGAQVTTSAAATLTASSTLTAAATPQAIAGAALTSSSTLTAAATRQVPAAAALTATSTLTAAPNGTTLATATLTAASTLTVSATPQALAGATLSSTSTLSAGSTVTTSASAALSSTSTLTASATRQTPAAAALSSTSTLTAGGAVTALASVVLSSTSTLSASATRQAVAAANLSSTSTLSASGTATTSATATLSSTATLTVVPLRQVETGASWTSTSTLTVGATASSIVATSWTSTSTLTVSAVVGVVGGLALVATATLKAAVTITAPAAARLVAVATLQTDATVLPSPFHYPGVMILQSYAARVDLDFWRDDPLPRYVVGDAGLLVSGTVTVMRGGVMTPYDGTRGTHQLRLTRPGDLTTVSRAVTVGADGHFDWALQPGDLAADGIYRVQISAAYPDGSSQTFPGGELYASPRS